MADGSVIINTLVDTKGFGKGVANMGTQLSKVSSIVKKLAATVGIAFSVNAIINFGKEAIQLGSDLAEVQNVVDVTFGGMSSQINEFAKDAMTQFGLSELSAKQYASTIGAILKSTGFDTSSATEMSKTLTGLAGDIASFYNLSGDEAFAKLRSGITGETEPLKQLGINLNVANLEAYALSEGITKSYDAMTQQEQTMLRYNYILSVTADAQGDFARTSDSWANQTKILSERFNELKSTIGQGLINALTPVITVINTILAGLQKVANAFKALSALLFGDAGGSAAASSAESIADGYSSAADSAEEMEEATKAAGKAAKILSGLDEIKTFSSGSSSSGSSGDSSSGGGLSGGTIDFDVALDGNIQDEISPKIQAIVDKIQELVQPLKEIDFTPAANAFERLKAAIEPITTTLFEGLDWAWNNLLVPLATWTIEDVIPAFLDTLSGAFNVLNETITAVQPLFQWLWDSFLQPIAEWTGGVITDVLGSLAEKLNDISTWISEHQEAVEIIAIIIISVATAIELVNAAMTVWNVVSAVAAGTTTALGAAVNFLMSPFALVTLAIAAIIAIIILLVRHWDEVKEVAAKVWDKIVEIWGKVADWFKEHITQPIVDAFNTVKTKVLNIWTTIKTKLSTIWNNIKNTAKRVWDSVYSVIKKPINSIIGAINGMISGVVSGINSIINALNKLHFDIPDWVPLFGGKSFGFNLSTITAPQIPYLATGAVIPPNKEFMAVLGDQKHGTNIETPEKLLRQIVREETGGAKGGSYRFTAQLNRRTLFDEMIEEAKLRRDTTGNNPFVLV